MCLAPHRALPTTARTPINNATQDLADESLFLSVENLGHDTEPFFLKKIKKLKNCVAIPGELHSVCAIQMEPFASTDAPIKSASCTDLKLFNFLSNKPW